LADTTLAKTIREMMRRRACLVRRNDRAWRGAARDRGSRRYDPGFARLLRGAEAAELGENPGACPWRARPGLGECVRRGRMEPFREDRVLAGSSGLRSFRRFRHHDNRGGVDRPRMPRDRASSGLCRRRRDPLAEFHRPDSHARSDGRGFRIQERLHYWHPA
jgi:hypothetical protein